MNKKKYRVGVDLGGTKTEIVLLNTQDEEIYRERIKTPVSSGYNHVIKSIADLITNAVKFVAAGQDYSVGIGIPGSINKKNSFVQNANTNCLIGKPLQEDIERLLNRKVEVQNDANCFTLAEGLSGAGKGYGLVFGIIMGTGCGGGICINGSVREGKHSISGEWGHFSVDPAGAQCYCGKKGCIETKISGGGVEAAYHRMYGKKLKMTDITEGYHQGESTCVSVFESFLDDFGRCLGGLISILDPDAVVIGGGLSNIPELYTKGYEYVKKYAFHNNIETPVLKNKLGDSAGVFGAAWTGK